MEKVKIEVLSHSGKWHFVCVVSFNTSLINRKMKELIATEYNGEKILKVRALDSAGNQIAELSWNFFLKVNEMILNTSKY